MSVRSNGETRGKYNVKKEFKRIKIGEGPDNIGFSVDGLSPIR